MDLNEQAADDQPIQRPILKRIFGTLLNNSATTLTCDFFFFVVTDTGKEEERYDRGIDKTRKR